MANDSKSKQSAKVSKKSDSSVEQEIDRDPSSSRQGNLDNAGMSGGRESVSSRSGKNLGNEGSSKPVSSPNLVEDQDEDLDEQELGDEDVEDSVTGRHPSQREDDLK